MNRIDEKYLNGIADIMTYGYEYDDPNRQGVRRREIETLIINHLVYDGYPIISARKTFFKGAVGELLLFLKGENDIRKYWDYNIHFWDKDWIRFNQIEDGNAEYLKDMHIADPSLKDNYKSIHSLGKIYPIQYKKQYHVFDNFKENRMRTDLVVDAWQVDSLKDMALIPCHFGFQILGSPEGFKICWFQRSTDFMLGSPINIQYYFLMGMLLEEWSGHTFLGITGILNNCHLYDNQFDLAEKMLPMIDEKVTEPYVTLKIPEGIKDLSFEEFIKHIEPKHFELKNYTYLIDETVEMLTYTKQENKI